MHHCTTRGCGVSPLLAVASRPWLLLDTQQQPGPAVGQQLVQKVTQVQSGAPTPLLAQLEYGEVLTVPSKSMPQLK